MSSAIGAMPPTVPILADVGNFEAPAPVGAGSAGTDPSRAALHPSFGAFLFPTGPLGTRAPRNAEDSEILLAQAALAIDAANREATDARIANATASARGSVGRAIADVIAVAEQQQATQGARVTAEADRTTAVGTETELAETVSGLDRAVTQAEADLASVGAGINSVEAQIAAVEERIGNAASEAERALLQVQLNDLEANLAGLEATRDTGEAGLADLQAERTTATANLTSVRQEITRLNGVIAELDTTLAALAVKAQESSAALLTAYSQVAMQAQASRDAQREDRVASINLDRSLDTVSDNRESFRANALARFEDTVQADRLRDDEAESRLYDTAVGLVAGLAELVDVLRRTAGELTGEPAKDRAVDGRESAARAGRLQLSL